MPTPKNFIKVLDGVTATNGLPSAASDGTAIPKDFLNVNILVANSAGSGGSLDVTIRLWVYHYQAEMWFPLGTGDVASKGLLNDGAVIPEIDTNLIRHSERLTVIRGFERLYFEVTALSGTGTAIDAWISKDNDVY